MHGGLQNEIDANFDFFQRSLAKWLPAEAGRYALLRHRQAVAFFDRPEDADRKGTLEYEDGLFSIQRVEAAPVELGLFSNAAN